MDQAVILRKARAGARVTSGPEASLARTLERLAAGAVGGRTERCEPLAAGLGLRRFFRLHLEAAAVPSLIARVEAPEDPAGRPAGSAPEPALEPIRAHLEAHGLPVPRRLGAAPGIELLEDLGDLTLEQAVRGDAAERSGLYRQVLEDVARLQRVPPTAGVDAFERRLDDDLFAYKADLFATWSLPHALGREPLESERAAVRSAFGWIATSLRDAPRRLSHRDLQSRNVLVHDGRTRWIDLQGAFLAPPEYDLVCLLRDSYVELPAAELDALLAAIRPELPDAPPVEAFQRRFDLLTLTRKGKDHARFLYAARTRDDAAPLAYLPPTARALQAAATRSAGLAPPLAHLAELVAQLPTSPGPTG